MRIVGIIQGFKLSTKKHQEVHKDFVQLTFLVPLNPTVDMAELARFYHETIKLEIEPVQPTFGESAAE